MKSIMKSMGRMILFILVPMLVKFILSGSAENITVRPGKSQSKPAEVSRAGFAVGRLREKGGPGPHNADPAGRRKEKYG